MQFLAHTRVAVLALALAVPAGAMAAAEPRQMGQAEVNETLRNDPQIYNGLYLAATVAEIVRRCESLAGPGRLARTTYFLGLYNQARRLGFTRAQIEGFVEDEDERERLSTRVRAYVESKGARMDDPASICALGRAEMAAGTPVGRRLSER
ncbi:DUF5333 family protein [Pararhodobacter sp. SW119]|uniref:DUF5333 family protein n=1 Tax=Pararhodobacter sp. SW119 TaxID=2780075 RepID=UPI001ADF8E95|nr:DUF5333 family protein [Pararhodobacter sp. SW119]